MKNLLNGQISGSGYAGGDCVRHSDEAGRPFVSSIEYPFIAFVPYMPDPYAVCGQGEMREFLGLLRFRYYVTLNPGWHRQLGIQASPAGSYEV